MRARLALVLLLPLLAFAQSRSSYFDAADTDHDDKLSLPEFQEWMSFAFRQMDKNHDEVIEPEEQLVPNAKRLTLAELHARQAEQFKRQDRNHDGLLTQAEFLAPPQ
jgi:Ca2+-binding EF-hand superfamily protein